MTSIGPDLVGSVFFPSGGEVSVPLKAVAVGDVVEFSGAEARHASVVKRVQLDERVTIGDGHGLFVSGDVIATAKTSVQIRVTHIDAHQPTKPALMLIQALAKGGRDEMAIQAATELGVDKVVPWAAEHSISRWKGAKVSRGQEKWRNIVVEASKQSLRSNIPTVLPLHSSPEVSALCTPNTLLVIADPRGKESLADTISEVSGDSTIDTVGIVIGPEGGISKAERELFVNNGAQLVQMGTNVLRTSTAGPTALAIIQTQLGRW